VRFVSFNKLTKHHRLLAVFDAIVLSEAVGQEVALCKIIHGDDYNVVNMKTGSLTCKVRKLPMHRMRKRAKCPTPFFHSADVRT
jgi:hypothetical protein